MWWGSSDTPGGFSIGKNHKCWKHHTQFQVGVTVTLVRVSTTLLYLTHTEVFIKWLILIECMTKYRTPSSDKLVEQLIQHLKNSGVRCDTVHNFNSVYAKRTTRTRRWSVDTGFAGDSGIQNTVSTHTRHDIGITRTDCQYTEPDRQDTTTVGQVENCPQKTKRLSKTKTRVWTQSFTLTVVDSKKCINIFRLSVVVSFLPKRYYLPTITDNTLYSIIGLLLFTFVVQPGSIHYQHILTKRYCYY